MPVSVTDADILRCHAAVPHSYGCGRHDSCSGTNETASTDFNSSRAFPDGPYGKSDFFIRCGNHGGTVSQINRPPENFHLPGFHKHKPPAIIFKLRRQKIPSVFFLKSLIKMFNVIWTIIPSQCRTLINVDENNNESRRFADHHRASEWKIPQNSGIFTDFGKPKTCG
jgi:hypothetical protein